MVTRVYGGSNFNALMGAGGWVTSAADLARLVAAIDKDPKVADVIKAESVDCLTAYDPEKKENLSRGWAGVDEKGSWVRTGTLSSTHALVQHTPDGQCWVIITNSGVWTGSKFSKDMQRLIDRLRDTYSPLMPRRNLWH